MLGFFKNPVFSSYQTWFCLYKSVFLHEVYLSLVFFLFLHIVLLRIQAQTNSVNSTVEKMYI